MSPAVSADAWQANQCNSCLVAAGAYRDSNPRPLDSELDALSIGQTWHQSLCVFLQGFMSNSPVEPA